MYLWFGNLIIPEVIFFQEMVASYVFPFLYKHEVKLVRKLLSGASISASDESTGYSWRKDSKSFSYFLKYLFSIPISLVFLCCQQFLCYRRALVSSSSNMNRGKIFIKSAQNERVEGVASPWKESYLSELGFCFWRTFFLYFPQQQLFCEGSELCSVRWLDVHLWDSHKILDSTRGRASASQDTR